MTEPYVIDFMTWQSHLGGDEPTPTGLEIRELQRAQMASEIDQAEFNVRMEALLGKAKAR